MVTLVSLAIPRTVRLRAALGLDECDVASPSRPAAVTISVRRVRRRAVALALLGPVVVGACASEADPRADGRSNTPQITVGAPAPDVEDLLLSESEVREVAGLSAVVADDLADVSLYENPDPRGPCGAELDSVPAVEAGRAFTSATTTAIQLVYVDDAAVARYLEEVETDLRPGCGPHESLTNVGAVQHVSEPVAVDTAGIGDRSMAYTSEISVGGRSVEAGVVVLVSGDRTTLIQVMGPTVDEDQVLALATAAAVRLEG